MKLITCNRCHDTHEVVMPPITANQFTAYCPRCQFVTMHKVTACDDAITYASNTTESDK